MFSEVEDDLEIFKTLQTSGRRKPNPAFIVAVAILTLAAAGLLYGFAKWRETSKASPNGQKALRPAFTRPSGNVSGNSATRSFSNKAPNPPKSIPPKTADSQDRRDRADKNGLTNISVADQVERLEQVKLANPNVARQASDLGEPKIESSRQIKIPEIRLPAAEVQDHNPIPAPKPRVFDTYRPRSVSSWTERPRD